MSSPGSNSDEITVVAPTSMSDFTAHLDSFITYSKSLLDSVRGDRMSSRALIDDELPVFNDQLYVLEQKARSVVVEVEEPVVYRKTAAVERGSETPPSLAEKVKELSRLLEQLRSESSRKTNRAVNISDSIAELAVFPLNSW